jgi:hypothetical protein
MQPTRVLAVCIVAVGLRDAAPRDDFHHRFDVGGLDEIAVVRDHDHDCRVRILREEAERLSGIPGQ